MFRQAAKELLAREVMEKVIRLGAKKPWLTD
jgi:hypothetical protein